MVFTSLVMLASELHIFHCLETPVQNAGLLYSTLTSRGEKNNQIKIGETILVILLSNLLS